MAGSCNATMQKFHLDLYCGIFYRTKLQEFFRGRYRRKCFWLPEHEAHVAQNFEKKAGQLLKGALGRVREEQAKPDWIRPEAYNKLLQYWPSDEFKKQSEKGKLARNSTKGGSLHTSGAKSHAAVRKELELKEKRILSQDEAFRITHVKKKKNSEEPDKWVEERAKQSYIQFQQSRAELCSSLPPGTELTDEQLNELWMATVGGPTRFGTTYGMANRAFCKFQSPLQGIGSSNDAWSSDRASVMAMEQKIVELSIQLQASESRERRRDEQLQAAEDRERRRDEQFAGMKAQLDLLLSSRAIPLYPDDARSSKHRPPHSQSRSRHREVGQEHRLVDESSSGGDEF
ncbi:uncharacterized protein LOC132630489 [Lycium barbarum]|uniref:uncharacterized protein LOC132630489 n=1 Tax=Lycium barbarum TaxID=112863 RepID=UPI00293F7121|nr:uncharacterized protein LOC132630489 [Lycium barbarum]